MSGYAVRDNITLNEPPQLIRAVLSSLFELDIPTITIPF